MFVFPLLACDMHGRWRFRVSFHRGLDSMSQHGDAKKDFGMPEWHGAAPHPSADAYILRVEAAMHDRCERLRIKSYPAGYLSAHVAIGLGESMSSAETWDVATVAQG